MSDGQRFGGMDGAPVPRARVEVTLAGETLNPTIKVSIDDESLDRKEVLAKVIWILTALAEN